MTPPPPLRSPALRWALPLAALLAPGAPAQFVRNTVDLPASQSPGENGECVALVDVEGDGDLDIVIGRNGSSVGGAQNLLWINQGGAQGGVTGRFVDESAQRLPTMSDATRGIEPADIDGDGDVDLLVVNLSLIQPSSWWINQGGIQGGTAGYFVDETAARWLFVGAQGSSFPPSVLLPSGLFPGMGADAAFGDFDDDGDLDLVYAANGDLLVGVPTRVFLNDGQGRFQEHNPTAFVLPAAVLPTGAPGLWCEGVHTPDTSMSDGSECDVVSRSADVDVADVDGDFDVDILVGDLADGPRLYANRRFGSGLAPEVGGSAFGFRDVTGAAFPTTPTSGGAHYAQEFGDLDGDGDLDLYGVNWHNVGSQRFDVTLTNFGSGVFGSRVAVPGSEDDDDDCALFDYDGDGDLDVTAANYSKGLTFDTLFRNDTLAADAPVLTDRSVDLANTPSFSSGVRAGDLDGDGDDDLLMAGAFSSAHVYFENQFDVPDTRAPRVVRVEVAPHRTQGPAPTVIHAAVLDNGPMAAAASLSVALRYTVDGGGTTVLPMRWSGGQIYRGELPGALVGLVSYEVVARDARGNTGGSVTQSFLATTPGQLGATYCTPSPNSTGAPARISAAGSNQVSLNSVTLAVSGLPQSSWGYFLVSSVRGSVSNPAAGQGTLCLFGLIGRFVGPGQVRNSGTLGAVQLPIDLLQLPTPAGLIGVAPGDLWHFTYWYRDMNPATTTNFADGLSIGFVP